MSGHISLASRARAREGYATGKRFWFGATSRTLFGSSEAFLVEFEDRTMVTLVAGVRWHRRECGHRIQSRGSDELAAGQ